MPTPENIRYYAAGHLAGAVALTRLGMVDGARALLGEVEAYMRQPTVDHPPPLIELLMKCRANPESHVGDIAAIEALFVHEANTALEQAGIRLGNA